MPILFVAGEDDELLDAPAAAKRLVKNAPQADIRLLPGAGHIIQNAAQYLVPYLTVVNGG
jgi:pimeloyl-ACP methyl ester carboxylesterase